MPNTPIEIAIEDRFRQDLDEAAFLRKLNEFDVVTKLDHDKLWGDGPGQLSFDALFGFYRQYGRSDLDDRLKQQDQEWQRFLSAAKILRKAAKEIRWALKTVIPVNIVVRDGELIAIPPQSNRVLQVLADAANILDVTPQMRAELVASESPDARIRSFSDQLEATGKQLKPKHRGSRPDHVADRFFEAWKEFAVALTGRQLDEIGALMLAIATGKPSPVQDLPRQRRRAKRRAKHGAGRDSEKKT